MTPAINSARKAKIKFTIHPYEHDQSAGSYGEEAADKLNISGERVFKTLIVSLEDNELAAAVLPVSKKLNLKSFAAALGVKKASMANHKDAERATGYVPAVESTVSRFFNIFFNSSRFLTALPL